MLNLLAILAALWFLHLENQRLHLILNNNIVNYSAQQQTILTEINNTLGTLSSAPAKCPIGQNNNVSAEPNALVWQRATQWQIAKLLTEMLDDLVSTRDISGKLRKLYSLDNPEINSILYELHKIKTDSLPSNQKLIEKLSHIHNKIDDLYKNPYHLENAGVIGWLQNKLHRLIKISSLHEENQLLEQKQSITFAIQSIKANDIQSAYDVLKSQNIEMLEFTQLLPDLQLKANLQTALQKMLNITLQSD